MEKDTYSKILSLASETKTNRAAAGGQLVNLPKNKYLNKRYFEFARAKIAVETWIQYKHINGVGYKKPRPVGMAPEVICISGASRSERMIEDDAVHLTITGIPGNRFINGYSGESIVVINDWVPKPKDRQLLLALADKYPYTASIKYGSIEWNPMKIYFINSLDQSSWLNSDESWNRRVTSWENIE